MNRSEENQKVSKIVTAWFDGEYTMFDPLTEEPELAWQAINEIIMRDLTEDQMALLAGGPLETLLSLHGGAFIDRVEGEAKRNQRFNHLLGGIWRHEMPKEIWERIERARKEVW